MMSTSTVRQQLLTTNFRKAASLVHCQDRETWAPVDGLCLTALTGLSTTVHNVSGSIP